MDKQRNEFLQSRIILDKEIEILKKSYENLEKETSKQIAQFQRKQGFYESKLDQSKKKVWKIFFCLVTVI